MTDLTHARAQRILHLLDLTALGHNESMLSIYQLVASANTRFGTPAALCIWPDFVPTAKKVLLEHNLDHVRVASIANFPHGDNDPLQAANETLHAVALGADEVDVVFPWRTLQKGNGLVGSELIKQCVISVGNSAKLKVIIESGELAQPLLIRQACNIAIKAGAHFLKTSTGKTSVGATPLAVEIMLNIIRTTKRKVGLKVSGGIHTVAEADQYLQLAEQILGEAWVTPEHFRVGSSRLLPELLAILEGTPPPLST